MSETSVSIAYYSDVLCVWAYVAQARLDELSRHFGDRICIEHRFVSIFGNTADRIGRRWADRGGYEGYASHVREVVAQFDHVELSPDTWTRVVPAGSLGAHALVRAASLSSPDAVDLPWRLRLAFFREGRDIGRRDVQLEIVDEMKLDVDSIRGKLDDGTALAALAADHDTAASLHITGSPTFSLNSGRQTLYGNVGYRIIEANVQELLRDDMPRASWC